MSADVIELFAGPGGWSEGAALLGVASALGIEWDETAAATARAAGHERIVKDVAKLDPRDPLWSGARGEIASPPCQGFSNAGKGLGRLDVPIVLAAVAAIASGRDVDECIREVRWLALDERTALVLEPLRWALAINPEWIAWEQVPAVLPLWEACAAIFRARGYSVWVGKMQAEAYGVPQTRTRAVLIASRVRTVSEPPRVPGIVTMRQALAMVWMGDHPDHFRSNQRPGGSNDYLRRAVDHPSPTITGTSRSAAWVMRSNYGTGGDPTRRGIRTLDQPAPTVTGKIDRNKWIDDGRPYRNVSIVEASVLQSFRADYPWQGGRVSQFQQVGNAVPPLLAAHILAMAIGWPG